MHSDYVTGRQGSSLGIRIILIITLHTIGEWETMPSEFSCPQNLSLPQMRT
jgi:hypothetical protein